MIFCCIKYFCRATQPSATRTFLSKTINNEVKDLSVINLTRISRYLNPYLISVAQKVVGQQLFIRHTAPTTGVSEYLISVAESAQLLIVGEVL